MTDDRRLKQVCGMFAKHAVESITPTTLIFREPKTWNCYIRYDIIGERNLVVTGDLGEAIYLWSGTISFRWLAGLDLGYFMEKCQASESGRRFVTWCPRTARLAMDAHVAEIDDAKLAQRARELLHDEHGYSAMESREEWGHWLMDNFIEVNDDCGFLCDVGTIPHIRAICHLEGIKLAMATVPERAPEGSASGT